MRKMIVFGVGVLWAVTVLAQEIPPITNGGGITLRDLVGTDKLITVVLKDRGASDYNLRVVDIGPDYFAVQAPDNARLSYKFDSVAEIRLQDGKVQTKRFALDESRSLKIEEQRVVDRAFDRAREIFQTADIDQVVKMRAAVLLAISGNQDAHDYLRRLLASNDLPTQLDAALRLYLVGDQDLGGPIVISGLQHGDIKVKTKAIRVAGLIQYKEAIPMLSTMAHDRAASISGPAARALGRLGYRDAIPTLVKMLVLPDNAKAEAALFALSRLGGKDVAEAAKARLKDTTGQAHYRLIKLQYAVESAMDVENSTGKELLIKQMEVPTLKADAALVLARGGDWDAVQYLSRRLKERYDQKEEIMTFRAKAAAAVIQGGDPTGASSLQELLRIDDMGVKRTICALLVELGKHQLIPILQSTIENSNSDIALHACTAVVAIAKPDFRQRVLEFQQ